MKFGPSDHQEAIAYAVEELKANTQYEILRALAKSKISQAELARRMQVSPSAISQALSEDANLTLDSVARIFLALELECHFSVKPANSRIVTKSTPMKGGETAWTFIDNSCGAVTWSDEGRESTVSILMREIRTNYIGKENTMVNDNAAHYVQPRASAAA